MPPTDEPSWNDIKNIDYFVSFLCLCFSLLSGVANRPLPSALIHSKRLGPYFQISISTCQNVKIRSHDLVCSLVLA